MFHFHEDGQHYGESESYSARWEPTTICRLGACLPTCSWRQCQHDLDFSSQELNPWETSWSLRHANMLTDRSFLDVFRVTSLCVWRWTSLWRVRQSFTHLATAIFVETTFNVKLVIQQTVSNTPLVRIQPVKLFVHIMKMVLNIFCLWHSGCKLHRIVFYFFAQPCSLWKF